MTFCLADPRTCATHTHTYNSLSAPTAGAKPDRDGDEEGSETPRRGLHADELALFTQPLRLHPSHHWSVKKQKCFYTHNASSHLPRFEREGTVYYEGFPEFV